MADIKKITITVPEDLPATYVNMSYISHTPQEFILDFAGMLPGIKPKISTRLVFSPLGAKLFLQALTENLLRYEKNFGEIKIPRGHSLADKLFRTADPKDPSEEG